MTTVPPPPQWEKSNKFVPLGQIKKNIFLTSNSVCMTYTMPVQEKNVKSSIAKVNMQKLWTIYQVPEI
jgi:hypothetical protein